VAEDTEGQQFPQSEAESTENQIETLTKELQTQNEALGGNLLITVPISQEDRRQVLLFRTTMKLDDLGRSGAYGVHPDKGSIEVPQPKGETGVAKFVYEYKLRGERFGHGANDFTFDQLDENSRARIIEDDETFGRWTQAFNVSKENATDAFREDQAKKQFLPKALEVVREAGKKIGNVDVEPPLHLQGGSDGLV